MKHKNKILTPINFYLLMFLIFLVLTLIGDTLNASEFVLAVALGVALGILMLVIQYWRNVGKVNSSEFRVDRIPDYILYVILVLGVLWNKPYDLLFLALASVYSLVLAIGLLIIKYIYRKDLL